MANFRHVTKCRGGSGGDLTTFLPVRCLMLKLVHSQISKPWECHLYFAQGCHLNFALTVGSRITLITENFALHWLRTRRGQILAVWRYEDRGGYWTVADCEYRAGETPQSGVSAAIGNRRLSIDRCACCSHPLYRQASRQTRTGEMC